MQIRPVPSPPQLTRIFAVLAAQLAACGPDAAPSIADDDTVGDDDTAGDDDDATNDDDDATVDDDDTAEPEEGAARYDTDRLHSPITPRLRDGLLGLAALTPTAASDVFMKVGDSMTVDSNALSCFAGDDVDMAGHDLGETLAFFLAGDADGATPFDRVSEAAQIGRSAGWATSGEPSPVERELAALSPRLAVVQFGTNDMQLGTTYETAIWGFGDDLLDLVEGLGSDGVVPILLTIPPRLDIDDPDAWLPTYNNVIRGIAQGLQVPLADLHLALQDVPGFGLAGDGVHLDAYTDGGYRACDLGEVGLDHGNNTRNLLVLEALDRAAATLAKKEAPDPPAMPLAGGGSRSDPLLIPGLPFSDLRSTADSPFSDLDTYTGCGADQDESGPEVVYRLELSQETTLRALVFDRGDVDVDVHLLDESATEEGCVERAHRLLETTLGPGTWHLALDSFVPDGEPRSGEFLVLVHEIAGG